MPQDFDALARQFGGVDYDRLAAEMGGASEQPDRSVGETAVEVGKGAAKGLGRSGLSIVELLEGTPFIPHVNPAAMQDMKQRLAYTNTPQEVGGALETAAEWAMPAARAVRAGGRILTRAARAINPRDLVEMIPGESNVRAGGRVVRDAVSGALSKPPSTPPPRPVAAPAPVATPGAPVGPPTAMSARPAPPATPGPPPVERLSQEALEAARRARAGEDAAMLTRFQEAIRAGRAPAPTAAPVPRPAGLRTPRPPAPTPKPKAKTAPAASTAASSVDDLQLTPAELAQGVKWQAQGVSPQAILDRILQSRQLTAATRTHTPDQAAEAVRMRNATGRWPEE